MSSEMREVLKKYETRLANFERLYGYNEQAGADARWNRAHMLQCRDIVDDLRALLARTEAGADGVVAKCARKLLAEVQHADALGDLPDQVQGQTMFALAKALDGHPQDASGDATMLDWLDLQAADGVHVEVCCTGNFDARTIARKATVYLGRPQSEHEAASVREAIRNAMQAKEAK